ncbi:ABC transporter ATP-binding protein [Bacillus sp. JCM 19046]|nr:ABC transporter ATP-binding protein [Bacillus sp. JCM 19045]GAF19329.1 ABC transporter ATP-binding protein [Bacillus sp. JCM 19046]
MKIVMENVRKELEGQTILKDVNITIDQPGIYAVLGPNGAGKTTIMHLLSGLAKWSSGSVTINGENPFDNRAILDQISFIQESDNFKPTLKVSQIIQQVQAFYPNFDEAFVHRLLKTFQLPLTKKLSQLSKGMTSALNMSIGLASRAPLTIFDEPYIGMDATARKQLYAEIIEDYVNHPRIILFSTHFIEETEDIFEYALIVQEGTVRLFSSLEDLGERAIKVTGPIEEIQTLAIEEHQKLAYNEFMSEAQLNLYIDDSTFEPPRSCQVKPLHLQEFFIDYTAKKGRA